MCRQLTECACVCICTCMCNHQPPITRQQNLYRVSLQIKQPYQCECQPCSKTTQIQTNDVVAGLLKYNSNLTKYLAKYQLVPTQSSPKQEIKSEDYRGTVRQPQKSIAELYNLKYLSPHDYPPPPPPPQPNPTSQNNNKIDNFVQTSPRNVQQVDPYMDNKNNNKNQKNNKKGKAKYEEGSNQDKIQKHLDQVAKSSRYLPNSGFKKYFGRECFENYGRQNTTGVADGIVYNNYLKTFNIAPHSGGNMPITEETYKRTLMAGDTNNYDGRKIPDTHYFGKEERQDAEGYHKKPTIDMPKLIEQSQNQKKEIKKFERPKYEPNLNIISHCPDIKTGKQFQRSYNPTAVRQKIPQTNYRVNQVTQRRESSGGYRDQRIGEPAIKIQEQPIRRVDNSNNLPDLSSIRQEQDVRNRYLNDNRNMYGNGYQRLEQVQNRNGYERWDDQAIAGCDRIRKKEILQGCYRNAEVGRAISGASRQKCEICKSRRYTKCCCIN